MSFVLAIDQGTTSSRAIVFRDDISIAAAAQQEFPAAFPGLGLGRARARGHLDLDPRRLPRGAEEGGPHRQGHRRDRHHQPARDHRGVGPRHRAGRAPRHRLAGPPHRRCLRAPEGRRLRADDVQEDRPDHRSLFLRHQGRLDPRSRPRRARARGGAASFCSAPSIATCCGASPAARCTPPTPPTPRARCCSTSTPASGTTSC